MNPKDFFGELKRRNVYRVAVTYAVIAWLLIQAASILLPTFEAPTWVMKGFVVFLILGFAVAVFISWAFEATPQGMKRTENVSPDEVLPPEVCRPYRRHRDARGQSACVQSSPKPEQPGFASAKPRTRSSSEIDCGASF